jgi:Zn-dependent protease with chaperone function
MPADSPATGVFVLSWGATYLLHSTCLLAGVWLYLRARPGTRHALRETLWKAALVGSIVTATAQMLPGLRGSFAEITVAVNELGPGGAAAGSSALGTAAADDVEVPSIDPSAMRGLSSETGAGAETSDFAWIWSGNSLEESAGTPRTSATPHYGRIQDSADVPSLASLRTYFAAQIRKVSSATVLMIAVVAAFAAIVLGMARCAWQTWSLRRRLARCTAIESGPARRLLDELRRLLPNAPEVQLLSASDDPEPAAFGVSRWTIVLPARAVGDLSEDELRALLAHELAHLVRGDSLWLCISRLVCSCLAFQPLNHLARREWQRAAEFLCDSWAVSRTGTPLALARCLAEVAGWRLSGEPSAALLAATGRKSGLADRIERLVETSDAAETWTELRHRRWLLLAGGILLGTAVWCFPRVQVAVAASGNAERTAPDAGQMLDGAQHTRADGDSAESDADAANPQASGEIQAVPDEVPGATVSELPAKAEPAARHQPAYDALRALLQALDRDLGDLEYDLRELEPLLAKENTPAQMSALANRLHSEIAHLQKRRDALRIQLKKTASLRSLRK